MALVKTFNANKDYKTLKKYVEAKLCMLRDEFCIRVTPEQEAKMYSLPSVIRVDSYALQIIDDNL